MFKVNYSRPVVVTGVPQHQVEIDKAIAACLSQNWTLARVDSILRAILRAASFELVARRDVPAKVVIDEYVGIARDFFAGDEPGFINAALDTMAIPKAATREPQRTTETRPYLATKRSPASRVINIATLKLTNPNAAVDSDVPRTLVSSSADQSPALPSERAAKPLMIPRKIT